MDNRLYETLNRLPGLFGISAVIIFAIIIIFTFIIRIFQYPHLRQKYFITDNTQSVPTRILKNIVFLFLTAGLLGVITYNVYKMIHDPPKLSVKVEKSKESPSMLICPTSNLRLMTARYYTSFNSFVSKSEQSLDLDNEFTLFQRGNDKCTFFNGKSSLITGDNSGGFYLLGFRKVAFNRILNGMSSSSDISTYIGDTNNEMNWNLSMPQGNKFSDVGFLLTSQSGIFQYSETRHKALNGISYRGFQIFSIGNFEFSGVPYDGPSPPDIWVGLIAPINVITQVEDPSLTLSDLLSNVGGYLSIWGIFGFLFGSSKTNPFGFVSRFVFIEQDKAKLRKELELSNLEKGEKNNFTETNNLCCNQSELKGLLAKYYVDMDFYEHTAKTPSDV